MRAVFVLLAVAAHGATLDGTVSNSATSAPVKKARVTARGRSGSYSATSDAGGRWSISGIPDGDYEFSVECQGFLPPASRRRARIPDDGPVALALTPLSVIAGKVVDEDGDPVPHIAVSALAYDYSRAAQPLQTVTKATTDDLGEYRLFDLKPGRYYVQAVSPDKLRPLLLYHPGALEIGQAAPVDPAPGAEVTGIDFRLRPAPTFRIRGTLTDAQTGEAFRAVVVAEGPGGAGPRYSASADGAFEFSAVQPGTYRLSVTQNRGSREMWGEQMVTVANRDVEDVVLTALPVVDVPGMVTVDGGGAGRSLNLRVTLTPAERPGFSASALPKPDGSFLVTAAPQPYFVEIAGLPPDLYVREIRFGAGDASEGRIDLRTGAAPLTIVLAGNPGSVSGTLGRAGVLVAITPADPKLKRRDLARTVFTDEDGSFAAGSLAPGEYRVFAWGEFDGAMATSFDFRRALAGKATAVTVRAGQDSPVQLRPIAQADADEARRRIP